MLKARASTPIISIHAQNPTSFHVLTNTLKFFNTSTNIGFQTKGDLNTDGAQIRLVWTDDRAEMLKDVNKLRLEVQRETKPEGRQELCVKLVCFVAQSNPPSAISITFRKCPLEPGFCKVTQIDILPNDSVIAKISEGKIEAVKKIFEDQKITSHYMTASGYSLVSFACSYDHSELYRSLIEGGADPNYCTYHASTVDLVTSIWASWVNILCANEWPGYVDNMERATERTVHDCISMSKQAIRYGCQIGCNLPWDPVCPTPLFLPDSIAPQRPMRDDELSAMFSYLVGIGFDLEMRNEFDHTPLLYTSMLMGHDTVPKMKALLSCGPKINVKDTHGRGPLHCALFTRPSRLTCSDVMMDDVAEGYFDHYEESMAFPEKYPSLVDPVRHIDQASVDVEGLCDGCWDVLMGKLVALLQAGCDPDFKDENGSTPSDYAWSNGFVWFAWEQALAKTGWKFDDETQQCVGIHIAMFEALEEALDKTH